MKAIFQCYDILMDLHDHILKRSIIFSSRVFQSPVIIKWSTNKRASYIASHRDCKIRFRNRRNQLRILRLLHVDAIKLIHQSDSILIDSGFCFRSGRIAFKHVGRQRFAQCLRNLAAAGVMDTDKCNFWFGHAGNLPFVLFAIFTRKSITGTSVNTPTVVASAAGEVVPNRATATATANSKKLDAPIIPASAAMRCGSLSSQQTP